VRCELATGEPIAIIAPRRWVSPRGLHPREAGNYRGRQLRAALSWSIATAPMVEQAGMAPRSVVGPEQFEAREADARPFIDEITRPAIIVVALGVAISATTVITIGAVGIAVPAIR